MLQINSGKLYTQGVDRTNDLRGVLYSNLLLLGRGEGARIETEAGTLLEVDPWGKPHPLVYELTERMDTPGDKPGLLFSHGIAPYMHDFSAVVSFVLRATCTPDLEQCSRLLSGKRSLSVATSPNKLVKRIFDDQIRVEESDCSELIGFVSKLIGLKRKSFLAAMRAIRTYVTGMHRVVDDLELAYTLLIASIESLAQSFDGHIAQWKDYDEVRRQRIDAALKGADEAIAERVHSAVMKNEHVALSRRFRDFALDHLPPSYFLESARVLGPGRLDLRDSLKVAYNLRSRFVHSLRELPDLLDADLRYIEAIRHDHQTLLTIQGLSRVAHAVITEFVRRQPKTENERYDYSGERHGISRVQLSPEYWIGQPGLLTPEKGRQWLEAFLQQFAAWQLSRTQVGTPLEAILPEIEEMLPDCSPEQAPPLAALYFLYNLVVNIQRRSPNFSEMSDRYSDLFTPPSVEALVVYLHCGQEPDWSLEQHQDTLDLYFNQRNTQPGFRAPDLYEAGIIFDLAERYRKARNAVKAADLLVFAAENILSIPSLISLAEKYDSTVPIDWRCLLPKADPGTTTGVAPT